MTAPGRPDARRLLFLALIAGALTLALPQGAHAQEEDPVCRGPENVRATTTQDGILVEWDALENATGYRVLRTGGGDDMTFHVGPNETSYLDADVEAGVSYTYQVEAFVDQAPSMPGGTTLVDPCGSATATAIPVFPSLAAAGLAAGLGLVGYAGFRRR